MAGWIKAACARGRMEDYNEIGRDLHLGDQYFMTLMEKDGLVGVIIFQRIGDRLHIITMGGENVILMKEQVLAYWESVAISIGCTSISYKGRIGWKRVLKEYEFIEYE